MVGRTSSCVTSVSTGATSSIHQEGSHSIAGRISGLLSAVLSRFQALLRRTRHSSSGQRSFAWRSRRKDLEASPAISIRQSHPWPSATEISATFVLSYFRDNPLRSSECSIPTVQARPTQERLVNTTHTQG